MSDTERPQVKPFAAWLQEQPGGLHQELSDLLADLGAAVTEHEAGGQITLTVKMRPMPHADKSVVQVFTDVKHSLPTPARAAGMFFTDDHGNLHRDNPRQTQLPIIRDVSAEGSVRDIDASTGEIVREISNH